MTHLFLSALFSSITKFLCNVFPHQAHLVLNGLLSKTPLSESVRRAIFERKNKQTNKKTITVIISNPKPTAQPSIPGIKVREFCSWGTYLLSHSFLLVLQHVWALSLIQHWILPQLHCALLVSWCPKWQLWGFCKIASGTYSLRSLPFLVKNNSSSKIHL